MRSLLLWSTISTPVSKAGFTQLNKQNLPAGETIEYGFGFQISYDDQVVVEYHIHAIRLNSGN
ncbi:hypothetical protein CHS0354_036727 [Potamilus streckersoni]|uniref:Uncharacterized protein n=1 Tax=Potamilus streckersoni TaxID=2493646 RepID=A0AAE0TCX1_9BIVA|nr:hypothetical protein CHS0354_036727 [Potamilus streckersoni]